MSCVVARLQKVKHYGNFMHPVQFKSLRWTFLSVERLGKMQKHKTKMNNPKWANSNRNPITIDGNVYFYLGNDANAGNELRWNKEIKFVFSFLAMLVQFYNGNVGDETNSEEIKQQQEKGKTKNTNNQPKNTTLTSQLKSMSHGFAIYSHRCHATRRFKEKKRIV